MMDNLKDRFAKWKININPTGEHMIAFRKYGHKVGGNDKSFSEICNLSYQTWIILESLKTVRTQNQVF